jgi:amino acid transporter
VQTEHYSARVIALAMTVVTGLYVVGVLLFGYALVTTDWSALGCIDGNEPACRDTPAVENSDDPGSGVATLADIRTSSWILAALALLCVAGSGLVALLLRSAPHLAGVVTLSLIAVAAATVLWVRV